MRELLRMARMLGFHLRMFAGNSYFAQLLFTSTLSIILMQWVASFAVGRGLPEEGRIRAGMMGTWVVCAVSTGLVGFQRFQGVLVHQVTSSIGPLRALLPVVGSASVFAMLAFPVAYSAAVVVGGGDLPSLTLRTVGAAFIFWCAASSMALLLAAVFSHSPDALMYESLASTPLVLVSGVFGLPASMGWVDPLLRLIPLRSAVLAFEPDASSISFVVDCAVALVASAAWALGALLIGRRAVAMAVRDAKVEVI